MDLYQRLYRDRIMCVDALRGRAQAFWSEENAGVGSSATLSTKKRQTTSSAVRAPRLLLASNAAASRRIRLWRAELELSSREVWRGARWVARWGKARRRAERWRILGLVYFSNENPTARISLYFNCPGALMKPCLAVYDVLQTLECEVSTVNMGLASGMGAFLCGAGTKGLRTALPNARFLMQRTGLDDPFMGQATDIANVVRENKRDNDRVEFALAEMTGHSPEKLQKDMKRDFYLSSYEAVQYGLIDQVLIPRDKFLGDYSRTQQYETQQAAGGGGRSRGGGGGGGGGNPVDQALLNADDTLPQDD
jgi:ATP-dependent Clp protease protease subunit